MMVVVGRKEVVRGVKGFQGGGGERSAALSQKNLARDLFEDLDAALTAMGYR